jgi:dihydroneopterin aldolase
VGATGVTIVKLGGSFALSPHLRNWLQAIADCAGHVVLVPGGGPFAEAVREMQPAIGFDDDTAHRMALLAMEQYGCVLQQLCPQSELASAPEEIRRLVAEAKVPVWLPAQMVLGEKDIPSSWQVTSDSLAAWLAGKIGAKQVVLVKQVEPATASIRADALAAGGIVDGLFPRFLKASGACAAIAGPDHYAGFAAAIRQGGLAGRAIELH